MKDYEQMYYDALYKIRKLEEEIKELKQQLEVYENSKGNDLKNIIIKSFTNYLKKGKK